MRLGSLFSGIGGFDLAARWMGWETAWFSEIDPYASAVLAKHWPGVPNHGDITQVDFTKVDPVDMLIGGFPCQDISNAGKRAGISGERSGLWSEYTRAIGELRPHYVVVENVAALLGRGLDRVLGDLAALGYDAEWRVLSAADVGAPHRRERVWIVAYPCGLLAQSLGRLGGLAEAARGNQEASWERERLRDAADGRGENVADTEVEPERAGLRQGQPDGERWGRLGDRDSTLADPKTSRDVRRQWIEGDDPRPHGLDGDRSHVHDLWAWWATEPDVGRVAHGIPSRVDRLKCLGNAIVPQCAFQIFQAIEARKGSRLSGALT